MRRTGAGRWGGGGRGRRRVSGAPAGVLALALVSSPAAAQTSGGGAGGLVQSYRFDDPQAAGLADFRLTTLPFAVSLSAGRWVGVEVAGSWAEGRATGPEGAEATLRGLTDTRAGILLAAVPDHVVLRAGATLPTGQSTQTLTESAVAGVVAAELLPFAISSWGNGGSVGGDLALAFQAGGVGVGLSGGYEAAREFEPLADQTFAYRPGDALRVRVALDGDVGESGTLSLVLGLQRHDDDRLGGANLFRSGDRMEGVISLAFAVGLRGSGLVYGGVFHRENGAVLADTVDVPSLEGATDSPAQQLFAGGFDLSLPVGGRARLLPDGDFRVFRTEDGVGQGWLGSLGGTLDLRLAGRRFGRQLVLGPTARVRVGHIVVRDGAESDLTGWEAGVTLRVESGR